ncbi:MAG TPA: rhomboid family intramembrane serine protease [Candidatus Limnocylindrales bacterium]|nr:rhomboid family intramembrane serine protease [Candidatus Limnocylindrales bacterium]
MFPIGDENEQGRGYAWVTLAIIAVNILVFVLLQLPDEDGRFTYGYSAIPREITHNVDLVEPTPVQVGGQTEEIPQAPGPDPIYLTLLTSMFMHGGIAHIFGNMLFLWIFGDNVEHRAGPIVYLGFYLLAGIVAALAQIFVSPDSPIPTLGASGAISGVLGAYIVLFPHNRVRVIVFRFITVVPAIVAIGLWALLQFINGFGALFISDETTGGVAYMAHVGGFVAGLIAGLIFRGMGGGRAGAVRYAG